MTVIVSPGGLVVKDPQAQKVYQFDWTDYLQDLGLTISSSNFTITGSDSVLTFDNASVVVGGLKTQLRLLGGTSGVRYTVTNEITLSGSPAQIDDRSIDVLVQDL